MRDHQRQQLKRHAERVQDTIDGFLGQLTGYPPEGHEQRAADAALKTRAINASREADHLVKFTELHVTPAASSLWQTTTTTAGEDAV